MRLQLAMGAAFVTSVPAALSQSIAVLQEDAASSGTFVTAGTIDVVETAESIVDLYAWQPPGQGASYNGAIMRPMANRSSIWFHRNTLTGELSLVVLHDENTSTGSGVADTDVQIQGNLATASYLVRDDFGPQFGDTYPTEGPTDFSARQGWSAERSDGYVIGPLEGDWTIDLTFTDHAGLDGVSADDMSTSLMLALENGRTIRMSAAPPNDECEGAEELFDGSSVPYDTTFATASMGVPASSGTLCGPATPANDLWYRFTAPSSGIIDCRSFDGVSGLGDDLRAFRGGCGALELVSCEAGQLFFSQTLVAVTAGETIWFRHADDGVAPFNGTISLTFAPGEVNGTCELATPVTAGSTTYGNAGAGSSGQVMSCGFNGDPGNEQDRWFSYVASSSCRVVMDTLGSDFDTILEVYGGDCGSLVSIACNDDAAGTLQSRVSFDAAAGTTYLIQAGSFDGETGNGVLTIVESGAGIGELVCEGVPNSTGSPSWLCANGSLEVASNDVELAVTGLPGSVMGLFVNSRTAATVPNAGGSVGDLCIASFAMGRQAVVMSDMSGDLAFDLDLSAVRTNTAVVQVLAGETWYWQLWHRDVDPGSMANTSNFSSAISLTFE